MKSNTSGEWLETDGLGGFASGTSTGIRTRRYHALLLTATTPPSGRMVLVNSFDAWVETPNGKFSLSSQCYAPNVVGGDGAMHIEAFDWNPSPHWIFKLEDGTRIEQDIFVPKGQPLTCISWAVLGPKEDVKLFVRPFLSGRDYHSLHKNNPSFRFDAEICPEQVTWHPYDRVPAVTAISNARYSHQPLWYYNFLYEEERARGLDCEEDLAAPGIFSWDLSKGKAALILTTGEHASAKWPEGTDALQLLGKLSEDEKDRRAVFPSNLHRAADAYIVPRHEGKTIIAGYPWFTDWGRDTFIAVRGLCLATGRLEDARDILLAWTKEVSEGMLPNRFPDRGESPEFNAVDASLWFIIASHEYLQATKRSSTFESDREALAGAIEAILEGYSKGTRYGIRLDDDGLLAAGERGVQLTWMDAKVGEWIVTQRAGKPVEVQALWLNALKIASEFSAGWTILYQRGLDSFRKRFWNAAASCLYDVIDVNHNCGEVDPSFRPNQILAIGGLPFSLLDEDQAMQVVSAVEERLWTPPGLRSLAPNDERYKPHYQGGVVERDGSYHQGTVWPWLIGPFVEAWVRLRGSTNQAKREARTKFLAPMLAHLEEAGLGHASEIADSEPPHTPRGCPFQAWSVGEVLRLDKIVLAESSEPTRPQKARRKTVPASQLAVSI
jgi:predicted glycogen debranching enzyme